MIQGSAIEGHIVKDHSQHTIGVEFSSRTVKLGEKRIKLQVCSGVDCGPALRSQRPRSALGHSRTGKIQVQSITLVSKYDS